MSTATPDADITLPADLDLSASQYVGVDINSDGEIILPTGAGAAILGVLQDDPAAAGRAGTIRRFGTSKMKLGGTVAIGDRVKVDSAGRAVVASAADIAAGAAVGTCILGGAINNIGSVALGIFGVGTTLAVGTETVTTGALSLYYDTTYLSVTGTISYTLADGLYVGQRKRVLCTVAATTPIGTLTPATTISGDPASLVFSAVNQMVDYEWTATGWKITALRTAGNDVPAAASTLRPLIMNHRISVTGTQDWVLGDGIIPGQRKIVHCTAGASTPVGTVSGLFYDEDGSADGIDVNMDAAGDLAILVWDGSRWLAETLVSATVST